MREHAVFTRWTGPHANAWRMYDETKPEIIGSGLMVGENGVALKHYFLPPKATAFRFLPGEYSIEVHARILNRSKLIEPGA
jgi:hypothetical protein